MAGREVAPQLGALSYSCPHCRALAHQLWFRLYVDNFERNQEPRVISAALVKEFLDQQSNVEGSKKKIAELYERISLNEVTYETLEYGTDPCRRMMNMFLSRCDLAPKFYPVLSSL
jgi:hypothetical protein